jgi:hypothetical protein
MCHIPLCSTTALHCCFRGGPAKRTSKHLQLSETGTLSADELKHRRNLPANI